MEKHCISCSMSLEKNEDIGTEIDKGPICKFCINEDGTPKTCAEVFNGGVQFFINSVPGTDEELAKRITRKNMKSLPLWQDADHECLKGEIATEEEFQDALAKLN